MKKSQCRSHCTYIHANSDWKRGTNNGYDLNSRNAFIESPSRLISSYAFIYIITSFSKIRRLHLPWHRVAGVTSQDGVTYFLPLVLDACFRVASWLFRLCKSTIWSGGLFKDNACKHAILWQERLESTKCWQHSILCFNIWRHVYQVRAFLATPRSLNIHFRLPMKLSGFSN